MESPKADSHPPKTENAEVEIPISRPVSGLEYLNQLPWERIVTWGCVCLVIYFLRDFFFVIFATFLLCYFAGRLGGVILKRMPPSRRTPGVQRIITVGVFSAFLLVLAGLLLAIAPELFRQGQAIVARAEATNIQGELDKLLDRTVGSFLYERRFGNMTSSEWQKTLAAHRQSDPFGQGWWMAWPGIRAAILAVQTRRPDLDGIPAPGQERVNQVAFLQYTHQNPDFELNFPEFEKWNQAFNAGEKTFIEQIKASISAAPKDVVQQWLQKDFMIYTRSQLVQQWLADDPFANSVRNYLAQHRPEYLTELGHWTRRVISMAFLFPLQSGLAFLIAFLISFDAPNILNRVRAMRDTRVRHYYDEIAPMMRNFGQLTGQAIEAQLVLGVLNCTLSVLALLLLGVDNVYFLATLIFIASIVPVIGAVFAVAIVSLMATIQPDGSLTLAILASISISAIHAFTSLILSPLIYGRSFHLHPVLVLVILVVAEHFFGMWGLVLGVPVAVYLIQILLGRRVTGEALVAAR